MIQGLYAVTPDWPDGSRIITAVAAALRGGATIVQIRVKADERLRERVARAVLTLCQEHGALCLINDDASLAQRIGAHGVHLGRDDGRVSEARALLGERAVIGVSCYNDFERAVAEPAATYVAFGSVFASPTKPDAVRAELALFARARAADLNTVAIGGITRANASQIVAAGADSIAVISDLFGDGEPAGVEDRAREFQAVFDRV